jgi:hypothetical protein
MKCHASKTSTVCLSYWHCHVLKNVIMVTRHNNYHYLGKLSIKEDSTKTTLVKHKNTITIDKRTLVKHKNTITIDKTTLVKQKNSITIDKTTTCVVLSIYGLWFHVFLAFLLSFRTVSLSFTSVVLSIYGLWCYIPLVLFNSQRHQLNITSQ